jgi:hypothetical protein
VALVRSLQPAPEADMAQLFRDDASWTITAAALSAAFAPDAEIVAPGFFDLSGALEGIEGLRAGWLQWLAPWESYRSEVEEAIDLGDTVLLLIRD